MEPPAPEGIASRSDAVRAAVRERPIAPKFMPVGVSTSGANDSPMRLFRLRMGTP